MFKNFSPYFSKNSDLSENISLQDESLSLNDLLNDSNRSFKNHGPFELNEDLFIKQSSSINQLEKGIHKNKTSNLPKNTEFENFDLFNKDLHKNDDDKFEDNEDEDEMMSDNGIYLCLLYQNGKLAWSYYDINKKCLFYMIDIEENSKFELTDLLIQDLNPNFIITCTKSELKFVNYLKMKCKYTVLQNESNEHNLMNDNDDDDDDETSDANLYAKFKKRDKVISFILMPNNDFNYELSKQRIFSMNLMDDCMPSRMNDSEKLVYFSALFDFDSRLMIRSVGALLKYLSKNRVNFELEKDVFDTPIHSVRPLNLDKLLILDSNTFKSLQIFNDVDLVCAYKQNYSDANYFRTTLNDKFNNTLYSLYLSKIQTKCGIAKLRSYMMKPTRQMDILNERHKIIDYFYDFRNQEMCKLIQKSLKKCKYINPILKRMRITKCSLNEWKRLYKTTQAFLKICEYSRSINAKLNNNDGKSNQKKNISRLESILSPVTKKTSTNDSFFSFMFNNDPSISSIDLLSKFDKISTKNENLFTNIIKNNYEAKFDYLINLFEKVINLKESENSKKLRVNSNISDILDEKKLMYSQLPEFLTEVAELEMQKYKLCWCKVTYLPLIGFLLVVSLEEMFEPRETTFNLSTGLDETIQSDDNYDNFDKAKLEKLDLARSKFEQENDLKFVFKCNEKYYYKTARCLELDSKIGDLVTDINDIESEIISGLEDSFIKYSHLFADMIDICAELDCLLSFSIIAQENNYVKPKLRLEDGSFLYAKKVRHPLVELNFDSLSSFIPNDVDTGFSIQQDQETNSKFKIITGPNASGKTVYLKQIALLIYMSMIGSYVPASDVQIGDFDRIYTRLNSNECISLQMSSFSIDLKQIAEAVNGSTFKSLILIDEFGKGTNMFDGQAVVASIIKYWLDFGNMSLMPHVYLSTHFHEMLQYGKNLFKDKFDQIEFLSFDYILDNNESTEEEIPNLIDDKKTKLIFLYSIKKDLAKSSHAFNIAKRHELSNEIIEKSSTIFNKIMLKLKNNEQDTEENNLISHFASNPTSIREFAKSKKVVTQFLNSIFKFNQTNENNDSQFKASKYREIIKMLNSDSIQTDDSDTENNAENNKTSDQENIET